MSDLPILVALARSLDRIDSAPGVTEPAKLESALNRVAPALASEDSKQLGQKLVQHFTDAVPARDERVKAILTIALGKR